MPDHHYPESQVRAKFVVQDHRRAVRFRSNCEALVSPLHSDQAPITVQIRDVSTTGIAFLAACLYERGTPLFISIKEDGPDWSPILFAKVVHATAAEDGNWLVGCKLMRRLSEAHVQGRAVQED
jgi:hypothetical protein